MKKTICLLIAMTAFAQRDPGYDRSVVRQIRIDLRDLGYPPVDVIPSEESAIRSLAVAPDGVLYGATSGNQSHLFRLDPVHGYVEPLGKIPGVKTVHHALAVSKDGEVYIGDGTAGHLFKYTAKREFADLGAVAPGEAVFCLALDRERDVVYGLTTPNGQFFSYASGKVQLFGQVAEHLPPGEKFETEKLLGRAVALDPYGNVYTSGEDGYLYRFDVRAQKLARLSAKVATVPGREVYNRVDAWAADGQGTLYGAGSDGYLFRLAGETVENLGKPLNQYRIRGLAFVHGKLYGVGGDDSEMARLFSYDPQRGVYQMLGMVDVNHRPYYSWQAYVIDSMAAGNDGTIYLGQSERRSRLFVYYPE